MLHMTQKIENNFPAWWVYVAPEDAVLLLGDAVYAIQKNPMNYWLEQARVTGQKIYALLLDVQARGLDQQQIIAEVILLTDDQWVELVTQHSCVQTW